jgi:hypothetical protein
MTESTKRVYELEVGDVVIFPGSKGASTISSIEPIQPTDSYKITCEGLEEELFYFCDKEVTY